MKQLESELSLVSIHPTQWHISFSRHGPCVQEWYEVMTSKDATMIRKGNKTNMFAVVLNLGLTDIQYQLNPNSNSLQTNWFCYPFGPLCQKMTRNDSKMANDLV